MILHKLKPLNKEILESIWLQWHTDVDRSTYIDNEIIEISKEEAEAFYLSRKLCN